MKGKRMTCARTTNLLRLIVMLSIAGWLRHRLRNWGASQTEQAKVLPGDELISDPTDTVTRAVEIHAPAETVWKWLVQIGQDRGGLYSYDAIENAIGLNIHSADEIHAEWQNLAVGDLVRLVPERWPAMPGGYAMPVVQIDHARHLVLLQRRPEQPWNAVWSFHIVPDGPVKCRLLSRSTSERGKLPIWLITQLMDPVTMIMTRRMLLGIKRRAEASHVQDLIDQAPHLGRHDSNSDAAQTLGA
jgi:hypothetical protein